MTEKRTPRRFRYTLRFLALAIFVFGVAFAWFAWEMKRNRERRAAVIQLNANGASISVVENFYSEPENLFGSDPFGSDPFGFDPSAFGGGADTVFAKLCRLLGEQPPFVVQGIRFSLGGDYSDEDFALLSHFPEATSVDVEIDCVSGQNLADITSISNLRELTLDCVQLPGSDAAFGQGSELDSVHLNNTELGDNAIRSICKLKKLTQLDLVNVQISASPESLRELQGLNQLTDLTLEITDDDMCSKLPMLPQVFKLSAVHSRGSEFSLRYLRKFPNLAYLAIERDPYGLPGPMREEEFKNLCHAPNLEILYLGSVAIGDTAIEHISRHAQLTLLDLEATNVTDAGMSHVATMRTLEHLDVSYTCVGDAGLRELWDLPNLEVLMLSNTLVTQSVRDEFFASHPDCSEFVFPSCF